MGNINENNFDLETYLSKGVENIVKDLLKISAFNPREAAFMARYAKAAKKAAKLRQKAADKGEHVPPFIIASITSTCNLHCAGCYARELHSCTDAEPVDQMSAGEWSRVFDEASDMGIGFILLAGGEPLIRKDVIQKAADHPNILFPVFTNGTMLGNNYIEFFDKNRNLVPMFSIEGNEAVTDERRGRGIYKKVNEAMEAMKEKHIAFGASITVTSENILDVTTDDYINMLAEKGCKAVIFVEFVPANRDLHFLALSDIIRADLAIRIEKLRKSSRMLIISFPGDEKSSGGCLAAGRGFFHINSNGGAEPCPFSPYSDINVREKSLKEVIASRLFNELKATGLLNEEHDGGCVLYNKRAQVEALLHMQHS